MKEYISTILYVSIFSIILELILPDNKIKKYINSLIGLLIVISGPSGVGKGTVRSALFAREGHNLVYSVSMTTRSPREGEVDGREYYFVSRDEFEERIRNNKFLEYAEFVGNYYGTPLDKVEKQLEEGNEVVLEIEVQGAMQVRKKMKDAVFIFIAPPTMQDLKKRLLRRGTECEEIIHSIVYNDIIIHMSKFYFSTSLVISFLDNLFTFSSSS